MHIRMKAREIWHRFSIPRVQGLGLHEAQASWKGFVFTILEFRVIRNRKLPELSGAWRLHMQGSIDLSTTTSKFGRIKTRIF